MSRRRLFKSRISNRRSQWNEHVSGKVQGALPAGGFCESHTGHSPDVNALPELRFGQGPLAAIVDAPAGKYRDVMTLTRQCERQLGAVWGGRSQVRMKILVQKQDAQQTKSISRPIYADSCIYVSKRDRGRAFFHIVKFFQNFIAFRCKQIRKLFSFFAPFPIFSIPSGRLLSWSRRCELRRYRLCGVRD